MKYPDTRDFLSLSSIGVIVSTPAFLFSNAVVYWMTTYWPSGAPGRLVAYCLDFNSCDLTLPSGLLAGDSDFAKASLPRLGPGTFLADASYFLGDFGRL